MGSAILFLTLVAVFGTGLAVEPAVKCPVPVSPPNGQVFLMRNGKVAKFVCDDGYKLFGSDLARCKDDQWFPELPTCIREDGEPSVKDETTGEPNQVPTTPRPLFKWDKGSEAEPDEEMMSDEARLHMLLYPGYRHVAARVHHVKSEKEEEKSEGKTEKLEASPVTYIHPRYGYVYTRAALHEPNAVSVVSVQKEEDSDSAQNDERLRYLHWLAQAGYPYPSSLVQTVDGHPVVMTLSESQLAWINSLYPEVRAKYLSDLYKTRAHEFNEELRARFLLGHYGDAYHWMYNRPYYARQPVSVVMDDPVATFDYSCHQVDENGRARLIRAPRLPNAYVHRYDRRRNPNYPQNHYLAAEYRCNSGYTLLDSRTNEVYCSRKGWVGTLPVCVPRG